MYDLLSLCLPSRKKNEINGQQHSAAFRCHLWGCLILEEMDYGKQSENACSYMNLKSVIVIELISLFQKQRLFVLIMRFACYLIFFKTPSSIQIKAIRSLSFFSLYSQILQVVIRHAQFIRKAGLFLFCIYLYFMSVCDHRICNSKLQGQGWLLGLSKKQPLQKPF